MKTLIPASSRSGPELLVDQNAPAHDLLPTRPRDRPRQDPGRCRETGHGQLIREESPVIRGANTKKLDTAQVVLSRARPRRQGQKRQRREVAARCALRSAVWAQIRRNWTLPRSCCRVRVRDGKDKSGNDERLPRGAHCGRLSASQKVPQITRPRRREERANRAVTRCRRRRLVTPDYSSVIAVRARVVVFNRRDASTRHACRLATAGAGGCRQSTPRTTVK